MRLNIRHMFLLLLEWICPSITINVYYEEVLSQLNSTGRIYIMKLHRFPVHEYDISLFPWAISNFYQLFSVSHLCCCVFDSSKKIIYLWLRSAMFYTIMGLSFNFAYLLSHKNVINVFVTEGLIIKYLSYISNFTFTFTKTVTKPWLAQSAGIAFISPLRGEGKL